MKFMTRKKLLSLIPSFCRLANAASINTQASRKLNHGYRYQLLISVKLELDSISISNQVYCLFSFNDTRKAHADILAIRHSNLKGELKDRIKKDKSISVFLSRGCEPGT